MKLIRWDSKFSAEETTQVLFHLSEMHLGQIPWSEAANKVRFFLRNGDLISLCNYKLDYATLTLDEVLHIGQVIAFFKKRDDLNLCEDASVAAWFKFVDSELLCEETNAILRLRSQGGFYFPLDVEPVLYRAQRKISEILGDVPDFSSLKFRFGPGATTQVKKKDASARRKLSQKYCCSGDLAPILGSILEEMPNWVPYGSGDSTSIDVLVQPARLDSVSKSALTDRTIAVEPSLNSMFQLGIGKHMASQLKAFGVDIRDQSRNQRLARKGSLSNALATLDLSSASDTIATGLVYDLLPLDWALLLDQGRSSTVETPTGDYLRLQKFSSMGNGFTFPLETLIFYALASSCVEGHLQEDVSVYGDDIIVPVSAVPLLIKTLTCLGFLVNADKSFTDGPFRESCGKDYFSGIDVRPAFISGSLSGSDLFVLHNFYARRGHLEFAQFLLQFLDESLKLWGPDGFGDGHLIGVQSSKVSKEHQERGWSGYTFSSYTYKSPAGFYRLGADYVFPSYSIYMKESDQPDDANSVFRSDISVSVYKVHKGKWMLEDILPGVSGYKRISIYVLN